MKAAIPEAWESPTPEQLTKTREAAGLTKEEARMLVCVALRTWQQWEKGDRTMLPGLWKLFKMEIARKATWKNNAIAGKNR